MPSPRRGSFGGRPPSMTPEEEVEEERKAMERGRLKRQPTFHNEAKSKLDLEGMGLGDFMKNREFGRAKLLKCLKENDHEWTHLLFGEAKKKNISWIHETFYGQTAWCIACSHGSTRCLKELVKFSNIDKTTKTSAGQSPIFQAVNANKVETLTWLLQRKDVEGKELVNLPKYNVDDPTMDGRTPLWQAGYKGYTEICKLLIEFGANTLKLSTPHKNQHFSSKRIKADDICLLLPHMERVKVVKVGDGEDIHTIREGDTVDAKYNGGEKFYKATVVRVNNNHTYDLEYYDGAKEQGVEKKMMHKIIPDDYQEPEAVEDSDEEEEEEEEEGGKPLQITDGAAEGGGDAAPPPPLRITDGTEGDGKKDGEGEIKAPPPAMAETPGLAKLQITDGKAEGGEENKTEEEKQTEEEKKKKKRKYKKVTVRFVHDQHEEETTTEFLQPTAWLGTLPSEAAKAHRHFETAKFLDEKEEDARKAARKKFRAVQALAIGMFAGRDESKYEGMV
eukprot:CAMPEP_0118655928 /NCGR_PEP_ID=MMETSP0785-20121206/13208_1 /TAXON_ID=91992 /ORGANISM="Bolidomonas pacifica, Strain CCMP 1866" /LENGTH=503 /DNA_ID=CAMNT_0006548735 /DNA_START=63 /DNA_END=1574 /DNA_ORIENTATION=+